MDHRDEEGGWNREYVSTRQETIACCTYVDEIIDEFLKHQRLKSIKIIMSV